GAPVTETQGSTFTAAYTIGNDLLRRNGEYPAFDGLGSARAETNSSGTATATQDFDAFGNTIASSGSTSSPYNFAGDWAYQSDGDAGLQHVGARYYDPQVGRFASRDSMLDQIPYAYCGGDGANRVDPDGQQYSDWNPFTWDYNFDATDWQGVADGAYKIGGIEENPAEIIGPAVGLPSVMDPGLRQPTQIGGGMAEIKTGLFLPAERLSVTGVAGAVLVGMFAGGEITQHIVAPAISWLLGKG
ncbi:MAG: RHS repeat-associated core domain-containing protein, partial [Armatimonadetes bacterium]|nr:RHS repeat-associated core domain-containing protein [Armatimonadota bacterium]